MEIESRVVVVDQWSEQLHVELRVPGSNLAIIRNIWLLLWYSFNGHMERENKWKKNPGLPPPRPGQAFKTWSNLSHDVHFVQKGGGVGSEKKNSLWRCISWYFSNGFLSDRLIIVVGKRSLASRPNKLRRSPPHPPHPLHSIMLFLSCPFLLFLLIWLSIYLSSFVLKRERRKK